MCIIIDTCTFFAVFNVEDSHHQRYIPILDWILHRRGKIIIGGSKYRKELKGLKVQSILAEFERSGRLVKIDDNIVDSIAGYVRLKINDIKFDDEHLVALITASRCKVICTNDKRAHPYLKRRDLYPRGVRRPLIYQTARNAKLCCETNIVDVCR